MTPTLPASITIGAQILARYGIGDSIEERFRRIILPRHLEEACWMTTNEDEQFRAAVGGLMLSYPTGSAEQERIAQEMKFIQQVSTMLQAAQLGMSAMPTFDEDSKAIGLMGIWHERKRRE